VQKEENTLAQKDSVLQQRGLSQHSLQLQQKYTEPSLAADAVASSSQEQLVCRRVTHLRCPSLGESLAFFATTLTLAVADTVHIVCITVLAEVTELNNG